MVTKTKATDSKNYRTATLASGRNVKLDRTEVELGTRDMVMFGKLCKLTFTLKTIGSKEATALLENSVGNRTMRKAQLDRFKSAMSHDHYYEMYDVIKIARNGQLQDGHHRLEALRNTGNKEYDFLIISGYPEEAYKAFDQNTARTVSDQFKIEKRPNYKQLSVAAKLFYSISNSYKIDDRTKPDNTEIDYFIKQHKKLEDAVVFGNEAKNKLLCAPAPLSVLKYIYDCVDEKLSNEFWTNLLLPSVCCRENFVEEAPIYSIVGSKMCDDPRHVVHEKIRREIMTGIKRRSQTGSASIPQQTICVWIHEAWQKFIDKKPMKTMGAESKRTKVWDSLIELTLLAAPTKPRPKV